MNCLSKLRLGLSRSPLPPVRGRRPPPTLGARLASGDAVDKADKPLPPMPYENIQPSRFRPGDLPDPDFDYYRRKSTMDPHSLESRESADERLGGHYAAFMAMAALEILCVKKVAQTFIGSMAPAADELAMAQVEIKLDSIEEGKHKVFKFHGKPLFVWHRTAEMIERERAVDVGSLRHPETDEERFKQPEWLVVVGVCTHLGCVPIPNKGEFNGYYCPCHGSHYDGSGRVRKGPAPLNLEVPMHEFDGDTLVVG